MAFEIIGHNRKRTREIIRLYRRVFSSPEGKEVLHHMMIELGFYDNLTGDDPHAIARQNYARRILRLCGIWNVDMTEEVLQSFFDIAIKPGAEGSPEDKDGSNERPE